MPAIPKPAREIDRSYGDFVRSKRCCVPPVSLGTVDGYLQWDSHECSGPVEAHHVSPRNGTKGTGSKVSDRRQIPACFNGHRFAEKHVRKLLPAFNAVIRELNREYDRLHPRTRQRRIPQMKVGFAVKNCTACHGEHFLSVLGVVASGFRCKVKNIWVKMP